MAVPKKKKTRSKKNIKFFSKKINFNKNYFLFKKNKRNGYYKTYFNKLGMNRIRTL
ncbi:hypothetical protein [Candidatus Vidania fulgoroideorum]